MGEAAGSAQAVDLDHFNPFDPVVQQCPHPYYAAMQQTAAVFHVPGTDFYIVTRHDLIVPILRDTATFSNNFATPVRRRPVRWSIGCARSCAAAGRRCPPC